MSRVDHLNRIAALQRLLAAEQDAPWYTGQRLVRAHLELGLEAALTAYRLEYPDAS